MWWYTSLWDMLNIIKANTLGSLILVLIIYFSSGFYQISRSLFIIDYILCTGFIGISRLGIRMFFTHIITLVRLTDKSKIKRVLYSSVLEIHHHLVRQTLQSPENRINIIGIFDDDQKTGTRIHGIEIIGAVSDIKNSSSIMMIYICVPSATGNKCEYT